ncbi:MAG: hypothetical protein K5657_05475 [Desulfovibrio sp.]|nr:hypothetical protein [Desulfovibrio sp.]
MYYNSRHFSSFFLFFCFSFLFFLPSQADAGSSYRRVVTSNPSIQSWQEGIYLSIDMDVETCKKKYGNRWHSECQAPPPGKEGMRVEGMRMTPNVKGVWRWVSETGMRFIPETHLQPDTAYTISLDQVSLPERYSLNPNVIYRTQGQGVFIEHETFWLDPSSKGKHVLSVPLRFIYPVSPNVLEKNISLNSATNDKNLRFGPMQFVWNESRDSVVINVPVLALPAKTTTASLVVQGFPSYVMEDGKRVLAQTKNRKSVRSVADIPIVGTDRAMDVKNMIIEPCYDENLGRGYQLVVTTSMQTKPKDVVNSLDLLLLPKKASSNPGAKDCQWERMPALSPDDIAKSQKLTPTLLQPAEEPATEIRLRLPVEAGRGVMCAMKTGLASTSGFTLQRVRRFIRSVPSLNPEINFLQPGNLLALRNGQKIDLHSVGLESISWRVAAVREPFLALAAAKTGFDIDEDLNVDDLSLVREGTVRLQNDKEGQAQYTSLDMATLLGKEQSALFLLTLKGMAKGKQQCQASRLLLCSDLGMMLKTQSDGSHMVFVRSVSSGKSLKGVDVRLLGANGLPVASAKTDADGVCTLPSTYGMTREKRPTALLGSYEGGFGWLSLEDAASVVSYDDFAVAGRHSAEGGLMASVFTERGVYMPGETLHFGTIVRNHAWKPLASLPLLAILYTPEDSEVMRSPVKLSADGMATIEWKSEVNSATGTYRLDVVLEGADKTLTVLGSTKTRVEEFQPDTLALSLDYVGKKPNGWISTAGKARLRVGLTTLYGEKAVGNRIKARFRTEPKPLSFTGYSDYTFCDAGGVGQSQTIELPDQVTDETGSVTYDLPLASLGLGSQIGFLEVEGLEKGGGRGVGRTFTHLYSPKRLVLGYKPEHGANALQYIPEGSSGDLSLLVLNENIEPITLENVVMTLSARRFVTSLVSDAQGHYRYDARPVDTELESKKMTITSKGTSWPLPTKKPGDYLLTVTASDGTELGQIPFTVAGNRLAKPGSETVMSNGSLRLVLDKEHYAPGDTIHFQLSAPFAGTGLVTLERDHVSAHKWFSAEPGESVHELTIPKDFEGRGYLNVSFVRDQSSEAIYMNPHAFAVAPITCGVDARDMGIRVDAPERVLPGEKMTITLQSKHKGHVQLFVVDEGILQLTDFTLPRPLQELLTERALDVMTREAYHLLMPDHERLRGRIPGFGGGMGSGGGRFLNPFRRKSEPPFAVWSNLLEVGSTPVTYTVDVPAYFGGAFRIMAVGSSLEGETLRCGSQMKKGLVRGSIILKPELPLVVAPNDVFSGGLVVANTIQGSGEKTMIDVDIDVPDGFELVSGKQKERLQVPENAERVLPFSVRVKDRLGAQSFAFTAKAGNKTSERSQSISVRPASAFLTTESLLPLASLPVQGDERIVTSSRTLYPHNAYRSVTLSDGSLLGLRAVLERLSVYPYGCTEQKISQAMPYAVLHDRPALRDRVLIRPNISKARAAKEGEEAIDAALSAIRSSIDWDGISMWPGGDDPDTFVTVYAADFLVTMQEHGLAVPEDLLDRVLALVEDLVGRTPQSVTDGRRKIYGAWVLQRNGRIMTAQLSNLEDWFSKNTTAWEKDVLASLLAESFATLRLKKRATERLPKGTVQTTTDSLFSTGMARALHALILEQTFTNEADRTSLVSSLIDAGLSEWATTVDLAMTSRALAEIASKTEERAKGLSAKCLEYAEGFLDQEKMQTVDGLFVLEAPGCTRFGIHAPNAPMLSALLVEQGFDTKASMKESSSGIEVSKRLLDRSGNSVSSVERGDVVEAKICARSHGDALQNAVLIDLVAGGLEPILEKNAQEKPEGLLRYERREDRALFFANLSTDERCFSYRLRAVTKGRFVVPGAHAEAMYEPAKRGDSKGSVIEVK